MSVPPLPGPVLVVCTGNICRSPFAAGALRLLVPGLEVSSAGTGALVGQEMDPPMARQLASRGGDPSGHRARQVEPADLDAALVLVMSAGHRHVLLEEAPGAVSRTGLLGAVDTLPPGPLERADVSRWARSAPGPGAEIADPYRRGEEAAAAAASRIWEACEQLAARLRGDGAAR